VWNTAAEEMLKRLAGVEMQGIGLIGHRGRIGHSLAQEDVQRLLGSQRLDAVLIAWHFLVRETGRVTVVRRMGTEPRLWARRVEGRPAAA